MGGIKGEKLVLERGYLRLHKADGLHTLGYLHIEVGDKLAAALTGAVKKCLTALACIGDHISRRSLRVGNALLQGVLRVGEATDKSLCSGKLLLKDGILLLESLALCLKILDIGVYLIGAVALFFNTESHRIYTFLQAKYTFLPELLCARDV